MMAWHPGFPQSCRTCGQSVGWLEKRLGGLGEYLTCTVQFCLCAA